MKPLRFSIAWIMTIVVVAAIDLATIRWLLVTDSAIGELILFGSMPMASILLFGLPSLVRALVGRGKICPFLMGFEAVGWAFLLVYAGSVTLYPDSIAVNLSKAFELLPIDYNTPFWQSWQGIFCDMLFLLIPQLVVALIGGWLNQAFKIRISIERRQATGLATMSPSGVAGTVSAGRVGS